ncbi:MAG: GAF domain-containing protein [Anaerolineales bacterium]|nr:GAF domain-containing protein [Anaerolineales bacterium]
MMLLPDYRIRQRDYLLEIARAMTEVLNLDELLERIVKIAAEMLAGQAGLIALRGEEGGWKVSAAYGIPNGFLRSIDPLLAEVPYNQEPARFEVPKINRLLQYLTRVASLSLLTGVALPLISRGQVIGLIFIFRGYSGLFSANDRALLQSFADQAAIAVQNAQLYTQVSLEKQRLNTILDSVADGILIMNSGHTIERCNQAFVRLWGEQKNKIIYKKHEEIIKFTGNVKGTTLEDAEAGGWPLTAHATLYVEGDLMRPNGVILPVGIIYAPSLSDEGKLLNIIASVRDITHFREAEELKSTFISVVSHELKTPVALIKGYVGTLRRDDVSWDPEIVRDSLEVIEEEADRLTGLIENLLDASRLQAGGIKLNLSDLIIEPFLKRVSEKFKTQSSNHSIVVNIPRDFPVVLADEERMEQVMSNLLSNAIKYSPEGEIRINGQARPEQIIICVQDEGPGIAPGDIPHIFDRFYRAEDSSRITKGAGLGLYLTKAIIEAHGGRIWVDPKPGDGARICFSLPRVRQLESVN